MAQHFTPPPPGEPSRERPRQPRVIEAPPRTPRHTYCRVAPGVLLDLTEWPDGRITARILELADPPRRGSTDSGREPFPPTASGR